MRVSKMTQPAPQHDTTHSHTEGPTRRGFLRRAGLVGAATAAFVGGADLLGLTSATATTRRGTKRVVGRGPDCCSVECRYVKCGCSGVPGASGNCCNPGTCCYECSGACGIGNFRQCSAEKGCPSAFNYCA
jgi:hypothetical protein